MEMLTIFLILVLGLSLLLFLKLWREQREVKQLLKIQTEKADKEKKEKKSLFSGFRYFKKLREAFDSYFLFKKNKGIKTYLYYVTLLVEFGLFVLFLFLKKPIFAIAFPLTFHTATYLILRMLSLSLHYYIQKELPVAIKHLIKVMSKTPDLKIIMYETSKNLKQPLRQIFFEMSRKMITEKPEKVLNEYAEKINNIWFFSFAFLLISYKEQSRKKDIVTNLSTLASMMDKETFLKEKNITDKKFVVIMNYGVALIAVALFIGNLIWNRAVAILFFFNNLTGMIALLVGIWAIVGTFLINIKMTKKSDD